LIASLAADSASQAAHLKELAAKLPGGDAERGRVLFAGKATCITCHTMGKTGVNFGPDLTTVAQVRSERDLLESIIYPSATFVRSFEPFVVVTNSGEMFNGILRNDAPDEVVLGTAPQIEKRIARSEIKRMRPDTISLMPQGFDKLLTPEEIADLIAFLKKK
jgi:putative heme-binding domain-containing protein